MACWTENASGWKVGHQTAAAQIISFPLTGFILLVVVASGLCVCVGGRGFTLCNVGMDLF